MRRVSRILRAVLFTVVFTFIMVNWHEIGHTVVARILGDTSARYALYQATSHNTCAGCNLYNSATLSDSANIVVNSGGVLFTQLLAWAAILLMAFAPARIAPGWTLWIVIAITWLGDFVYQLVQGLTNGVPINLPRGPEMSYTDFTAVIWFARHATGWPVETLRIILIVGAILYSGLLAFTALWAVKRRGSLSRGRAAVQVQRTT